MFLFRHSPGWVWGQKTPREAFFPGRRIVCKSLEDVDVLPAQGLVHAAHGAELAAHAAGVAVVVLGLAAVPDGPGGVRVQGAGELGFPVQGPAGVGHFVVYLPGAGDALGDVRGVGGDFRGDDALLHILHVGQGQVLRREQLLDKVWGIDFEGGDRAVDGRIKVLRAALGPAGKQIRTVFKVGYKLEEGAHG